MCVCDRAVLIWDGMGRAGSESQGAVAASSGNGEFGDVSFVILVSVMLGKRIFRLQYKMCTYIARVGRL